MSTLNMINPSLAIVVFFIVATRCTESYLNDLFRPNIRSRHTRRLAMKPNADDEFSHAGILQQVPSNPVNQLQKSARYWLRMAIIPAMSSMTAFETLSANAAVSTDSKLYIDSKNGFSLSLPPSWLAMPRSTPTPRLMQYQIEEVLFVASSFAEGASLSVTKTIAPRLLKDFDIEWWFAPISKMGDLGSAELIANLLILQRENAFEKRTTPSELKKASISTEGVLFFEFTTPLAEGISRTTLAKAYLRGYDLMVLWVSALSDVVDGDYGSTMSQIEDSFIINN